MRIPQNSGGNRTDDSSPNSQYVLPESEIIAFVKGLRVHSISTVALRLATIAFTIVQVMQNRLDGKSNGINLLLIEHIVQSYKSKQYRHFTDAIVAAIGPDKERFDSALMTIALALELLYENSSLYSAAKQFYEEMVIEITNQGGER
jgi:hypothetical protein